MGKHCENSAEYRPGNSAKNRLIGSFLALSGGAMWGISGTVGQFLFTAKGISAVWLTPIRMLFSGIVLLLWYFFRDRSLLTSVWKEKQDRIELLVYGLAGIACCQLTYFLTIQLSSAGVATILQDLSPVMILACVCIAGKRRPRGNEIASIVLALTGVLLIVTHGNFAQFAVRPAALLVGVICAGTVTLYNVYPKRLLSEYPVPLLQGWSFFLGGCMFFLIFRPWTFAVTFDPQLITGIIAVSVIGNLLAFNFYMKGVAMIGPQRASLYGFAEPVMAAFLSAVWLGSPFTAWDACGFVCVFLMLVGLSVGKGE